MSRNSEEDDRGYISDEELPEDLRPSENPLARDPDDEEAGSDDSTDAGTDAGPGAGVEGMPDLADPTAGT